MYEIVYTSRMKKMSIFQQPPQEHMLIYSANKMLP